MPDPTPPLGSIAWIDLTVPDAEDVRDFYTQVVGWRTSPVSMGEYEDHCVHPPGEEDAPPVAGICHARGSNANLPPRWLIYITVEDADAAARKAVDLGGRVVDGPRALSGGRFCVIEDPAGALAALWSPA